jgi:hypothetical protein
VNDVALDHEMKLAILALAARVMDAIAERRQAEADLIGRYQDVVSTTHDTVRVGGESLAIDRDAVGLDERVETASKFLRMVERSDGDYETTVTDALARFADLMES